MKITSSGPRSRSSETMWTRLQREAGQEQKNDSEMAPYLRASILRLKGFPEALGHLLADELGSPAIPSTQLRTLIASCYKADQKIVAAAEEDLHAIIARDPAATSLLGPFLFFKGYHALQAYRVAHWLWGKKRKFIALYLQSRAAQRFAVDIHPAARIGKGIMMDHAHGIVIGETALVEDKVSILHNVTLGGTGKESGDRHPKIRSGVMIGAGAKILGNIEIGKGARVAAGSVVLENVPPHMTVAGVPARIIGKAGCARPAEEMDQMLSGRRISR